MNTGIQISSFRPLMKTAEGLEAVAGQMQRMGCVYTQLQWIDPLIPAEVIADILKRHGLISTGVQDKFDDVLADPDYYLTLLKTAGGSDLCVSGIPEKYTINEYCNKVGTLMQTFSGYTVSLHPLKDDIVTGRLAEVLARLPELRLIPDCQHLNKANADIPAFIRSHSERIIGIHFKDMDESGKTCVVGEGIVPLTDAAAACRKAGIPIIFAEQETWDGDPYICLGKGFENVQKLCKEQTL